MKIKVGVSARHIHLTKETYDLLFDNDLTVKNNLTQVGEFASNEVLTIETDKSLIENVRILGPYRKYNQIEISRTDAYKLGINPSMRCSGNVENTPGITLKNGNKSVNLTNGVIIAERHIHMPSDLAQKYNLKNGQAISVKISGTKGMYKETLSEMIIAFVKISDNATLEMHIDTDDANAFGLKTGDEVEINL